MSVCCCFHACRQRFIASSSGWCCHVTPAAQADNVNVWCHCTGWLTCFFSLSVCLLQQWETFSERSSSSQTLTQFDSNIAPADPVSQSLSMHGFAINAQTLTLSGSPQALSLPALSLQFTMLHWHDCNKDDIDKASNNEIKSKKCTICKIKKSGFSLWIACVCNKRTSIRSKWLNYLSLILNIQLKYYRSTFIYNILAI